jgi:hypothetical protein
MAEYGLKALRLAYQSCNLAVCVFCQVGVGALSSEPADHTVTPSLFPPTGY